MSISEGDQRVVLYLALLIGNVQWILKVSLSNRTSFARYSGRPRPAESV
jgi:hypothetical protein